jgi:hypothetical protein
MIFEFDNNNYNEEDEKKAEEIVFWIYKIQPEEEIYEVDDQILNFILNEHVNGNNEEINDDYFYISPSLLYFIENRNLLN